MLALLCCEQQNVRVFVFCFVWGSMFVFHFLCVISTKREHVQNLQNKQMFLKRLLLFLMLFITKPNQTDKVCKPAVLGFDSAVSFWFRLILTPKPIYKKYGCMLFCFRSDLLYVCNISLYFCKLYIKLSEPIVVIFL